MKNFLAVIGFLFILGFTVGSFDIIDFHLCVKAPGQCGKHN